MSTTDQPVSSSDVFPVCAEVPATLALKQKMSETAASETWDAFDRSKKKKCLFKRVRLPADADVLERFKESIQRWEQLRETLPTLPAVVMLGQDADGVWYARDAAEGEAYSELVRPDKPMKEHEAARQVLALSNVLLKLHQAEFYHHNLKPTNVFTTGTDNAIVTDPDFGRFRNGSIDLTPFGSTEFLAPEQRTAGSTPPDARADIWSLSALLAFCLTGCTPASLEAEQIPEVFRSLLTSGMQDSPEARPASLAEFHAALTQLVKATRPTTFVAEPPAPSIPSAPVTATPPATAVASSDTPPPGTTCPQCHIVIQSITDRVCPQCGRHYYEPCLHCQSLNPFWVQHCRGCGSDLLALKQHMFANLNSHKQHILKYRESYGHDKTLPLLKYMTTVNHPDFVALKEWAKSMTLLIQKERRDIKAYVDGVRAQANAAMASQKYEQVRQILEQVPRPLLDEELCQQYVEAGEALTEVDSLVREIRNTISTKQYSQLLSCVQRYSELKANDPEAQNLQRKIEKLTTIVSANGMKLRRIPGGRFYMGSHDSDEYLRNNEYPQHKVVLTSNFFIGVYPVTQQQFHELMEYNPSSVVDNDLCPVEGVTWYSAVEFCNKMSEAESIAPYYEIKAVRRRANNSIESAKVAILGGDGFRLPTEAEWEYACRAGSITTWSFGDQVFDVGNYAWYYDNSGMETHPVGQRKPNSWGLFDMHGNVMEWCYDWYDDTHYQRCLEEETDPSGPADGMAKVLRGGAWQFGAEATRCAYRNSSTPEAVVGVIGFRVCRNAGDESMIGNSES
jgi:formylglycine-generating enzyme required for sulfatase activity/serine/threonine protein kinase